MLAQSFRATGRTLARAALQNSTVSFRRTLITPTAVRQADIVQDLYLNQLKAYKAPAVKAGDSKGHVQEFTQPKPPHSPEEANLQNDLKAYEDQVPEVEGSSSAPGAKPAEQDWFEEEPEEDEAHGSH